MSGPADAVWDAVGAGVTGPDVAAAEVVGEAPGDAEGVPDAPHPARPNTSDACVRMRASHKVRVEARQTPCCKVPAPLAIRRFIVAVLPLGLRGFRAWDDSDSQKVTRSIGWVLGLADRAAPTGRQQKTRGLGA